MSNSSNVPRARRARSALSVGVLAFAVGCATGQARAPASGVEVRGERGLSAGELMSAQDRARLQALVAERNAAPTTGGYRIGPDDLLEIRIPDLTVAGGDVP